MNAKHLLRLLPNKFSRILYERFPEPLHLNALSIAVALFGTYRMKIDFDLVVRQQYAFCLLQAAEFAKDEGQRSVTVIEFGVAAGAGLMNLCEIASKISRLTDVDFQIFGFDSGKGMPSPRDYRDHPEAFREGSFPLVDPAALVEALPPNARLILGDIQETLPAFVADLFPRSPLGFVVIDVDQYSSAKACFDVFLAPPDCYLPMTLVYLDDIGLASANPWVGELLAVREFNDENEQRKVWPFTTLRTRRLFKHASWIDQVYLLHVLDHSRRTPGNAAEWPIKFLPNPYL
ncbi:MAG: hypothetical protein ACREQ5_08140 [Candidatus Dormibacteria bacterium]